MKDKIYKRILFLYNKKIADKYFEQINKFYVFLNTSEPIIEYQPNGFFIKEKENIIFYSLLDMYFDNWRLGKPIITILPDNSIYYCIIDMMIKNKVKEIFFSEKDCCYKSLSFTNGFFELVDNEEDIIYKYRDLSDNEKNKVLLYVVNYFNNMEKLPKQTIISFNDEKYIVKIKNKK